MKVVDISATVVRAEEYPHGGWVLVRVTTDDGVEGWGECFVPERDGSGVFAAKQIIEHSLSRVVIGEAVLDIQPIWERMYRACAQLYDRRGLAIHALSGIDMALYDAAGKTLGVPVCRLLGGRCRERVRLYVSSIYVHPERPERALQATQHYASQGFTAIKYYGWPGFGSEPRRDAALLARLGQAAGASVELMLDLGRPESLTQALRAARMIEDSGANIRWWEEPLSTSDNLDGLAQLSARTDLSIAAGEAEMTAFAFRELISRRAVDVLQPDLSWVGGPTEGRRIAEMARLFTIPLVPHNWGTIVNLAASIHLVAAMPQGFLCEYPITPRVAEVDQCGPPSTTMTELASRAIVVERGYALVPDGPGLGIELSEEGVQAHMVPPH